MRRFVLVMAVLLAFLVTGGSAMATPDEGERDWFGHPPLCC